jgi:hypothetical protein
MKEIDILLLVRKSTTLFDHVGRPILGNIGTAVVKDKYKRLFIPYGIGLAEGLLRRQ